MLGLAGASLAGGRQWTIPDIADVRQIQSVAVSAAGGQAAYVVRKPSVAEDTVTYELYEVGLEGRGEPKRLLRATYIGDVTRSPNRRCWTVLADVGKGVQLYDIDDNGVLVPIEVAPSTVLVGGYEGVVPDYREPRRVGIWSYQWSPDGSRLWYSTFRVRTPAQREAFIEKGVEYDDRKDSLLVLHDHIGKLVGFELHVASAGGRGDRQVAFVPANQILEQVNLRRDLASALWMADSRHIQYATDTLDDSGRIVVNRWSVDVRTGTRTALPEGSPWWIMAVPTADAHGYYEVRSIEGANHLLEYSMAGRQTRDFGRVPFSMVGMMTDYPGGEWSDPSTGAQILSVLYHHHTGLVSLPKSVAGRAWGKVQDNLNPCDFSQDLRVGVCVRQSQTLPPELVVIDGRSGSLRTIAQPNAAYAEIAPLRVELHRWTNKYGQLSDGYVVYPRHFSRKAKYPVIVVTHENGAINTFADRSMIQAELPVQVLAENGYIVIEANTPWVDLARGKPWQLRHLRATGKAVRDREMELIQAPVASMEAAVDRLVADGVADPRRTGIAGYSDGAVLSLFAMTQSRAFKVASVDDGASGATADEYWEDGTRSAQFFYRSLYGGSAFSRDPNVANAYRRFCPDLRASSFAGPLLEQPTATAAKIAFARLVFLREAGIPYELVFYPHETHIFWNPRASAASMQRTLDWFNYWLLSKRSPDPSRAGEYSRWDAMRRAYGKKCPSCLAGLGPWKEARNRRRPGVMGARATLPPN